MSMPNTIIGMDENHRWNDRYSIESERLKTFKYWPIEWMDKNILAATGMYYTDVEDTTKCYFCEVLIGKWEVNDHPVYEHLRWSPSCPLLNRRTTNNMPLNAMNLDQLLPPGKTYDTPPIPKYLSKSIPDYSIKAVRLQTFVEWPRCMKQRPEQLAEAGFYYKGTGDSVICFSCLGGLKDWENDDDPWEQHALWMGHYCQYVKLNKGDAFVKSVVEKFHGYSPKKSEATGGGNGQQNSLTRQDSDDSTMCKICMENECNTAYVPCGHVVACTQCAFSVRDCPMCRAAIEQTVRLYFA